MLSRVADTLYWMSRYLERADFTARLIDAHLDEDLEPTADAEGEDTHWRRLLAALRVAPSAGSAVNAGTVMRMLTLDPQHPASIVRNIALARENARQARDRISSDMWEQINRLYLKVKLARLESLVESQPHDFFQAVMEGAQLFHGVTESSICHDEGWQFIRLGRSLERAGAVLAFLDAHADQVVRAARTPGDLDWIGLLRCCNAFEAYCRFYTADPKIERIAEFLLLNPEFPYSVRFSVEAVKQAIIGIALTTPNRRPLRLERMAGRLEATLSFGQIDEIVAAGYRDYLLDAQRQCALIHTALHQHYIQYPVETAPTV
jgi:uncharacterized alpha-E superfamily protein